MSPVEGERVRVGQAKIRITNMLGKEVLVVEDRSDAATTNGVAG